MHCATVLTCCMWRRHRHAICNLSEQGPSTLGSSVERAWWKELLEEKELHPLYTDRLETKGAIHLLVYKGSECECVWGGGEGGKGGLGLGLWKALCMFRP